jgi:hypothetical protein
MNMEIRPERPEDVASIHRVNELAFETPAEADLVDALWKGADPFVSLVAVIEDQVVGHILFTTVSVEDAACAWMGLAPNGQGTATGGVERLPGVDPVPAGAPGGLSRADSWYRPAA